MYISSITNNFTSVNYLKNNQSRVSVTETLSSGKRINRASDDAANTAISQRMTSQINGLNRGIENSKEGIALIQVYDGALAKTEDILQRMRELSIQSSTGTFSDLDRENLNNELQQLTSEIDRISVSTIYNKNKFLGADSNAVTILLSGDITDKIILNFKQMDTNTLFSTTIDISKQVDAQSAISQIDDALEYVINYKTDLGSYVGVLESNVSELNNTKVNLSEARSGLEDLEMTKAVSDLVKSEILLNSSITMLGKINQSPQSILKLMM